MSDMNAPGGVPTGGPRPKPAMVAGPAPTGYDRVRDAIYGLLGGRPANAVAADKLATAFDFGTMGMATGAYNGAKHLAETGEPGILAMSLLPGAKPVGLAAKGAGRIGGILQEMSSRSVHPAREYARSSDGYMPPVLPQRNFTDDYRKTGLGHPGRRLETDIDGRPLVAEFVAGRRKVGGPDEALEAGDVYDVASKIASSINIVPAADLPRGSIGSYQSRNNSIRIADHLSPAASANVLAHETGHAIDKLSRSGVIFDGDRKARKVYHDLATGDVAETRIGKYRSPESYGYPKSEVRDELIAEMLRAYMINPNYLKSINPEGAKAIRAAVNGDPILNKVIQFNTPLAGLLGGAAILRESDAEAAPRRGIMP